MNPRQILQHIDDGANHFLFTLADAPHMTRTADHGITIIQPKPGEEGVSFVCNLALAGLDAAESSTLIRRAKSLGFPVWFPLLATDAQFAEFFGRERLHSAPFAADDEVYMAMRPGEMTPRTPAFPVVHADSLAPMSPTPFWRMAGPICTRFTMRRLCRPGESTAMCSTRMISRCPPPSPWRRKALSPWSWSQLCQDIAAAATQKRCAARPCRMPGHAVPNC